MLISTTIAKVYLIVLIPHTNLYTGKDTLEVWSRHMGNETKCFTALESLKLNAPSIKAHCSDKPGKVTKV